MKTRTMYIHMIGGKPASFSDWYGMPLMSFVEGEASAKLVPSLAQLRAEQGRCLDDSARSTDPSWSDPAFYSYVRVKVPT